ncbi:MAG: hypothetical protein OXB95_09050, partial [Rhodobacteraceae bacterium]|nr:hypothetical protein [Paracoccaceae bacterium]
MDDETVFGVELFRKSYMEAVNNGWLSDYRIIALGVNDTKAYKAANELARTTTTKSLTTVHFLRGLALALVLGGATRFEGEDDVQVKSCIGFMNTVAKSKAMVDQLQSDTVRNWVQDWLKENRVGRDASKYKLEHLDASSNVTARENAKSRLANASVESPHGVLNVGIFGEGTDAPSLSAVAFLEARKSPIDVIQAVGRAMRLSRGKKRGYIICPIVIPPNFDAEKWLSTSGPNDGWQELGQILLALRAHDSRIEDNLAKLLQVYLPSKPETESTMIAIAGKGGRISYHGHHGPLGSAVRDVERVLMGKARRKDVFVPLTQLETASNLPASGSQANGSEETASSSSPQVRKLPAPATILAGKLNQDGSIIVREACPERDKPPRGATLGPINVAKSKKKARNMINKDIGQRVTRRKRRSKKDVVEENASWMLYRCVGDSGLKLAANLLQKSGLKRDRVERDANVLHGSVTEAACMLRQDGLNNVLNRHFGLNFLDAKKASEQADGCTIAALLMMNAAMLHQRIAVGQWLTGIKCLSEIKNAPHPVKLVSRQWNSITRHDFLPILDPAIQVMEAIEDTGKLAGLERALRHIASESERIAETYADLGSDHAGPLFNRVMGNQASDGAYFTRPVVAT